MSIQGVWTVNVLARLLPVLCACVVTQALADPPVAPASAAASAETPSATTPPANSSSPTAQAATPAAHSNKVILVDKTLTDAQVKQLLSQGYRPQAAGDQIVYCRREMQLGSHFETKICRTGEQIGFVTRESKEMTEIVQRTAATPSGK
jgi:hypothetical protein